MHALAPFPTASLLRDSTAYPCPPEVRHGARAPQADGTAWQEKKIKELENYLMMQTSLVVELRSTASLPAAKLVAANINGPTRTALRSDAPFATRRPLLGMIQEAHEAADETQMLGALKFAAAAAAALLVLVLLVFVSCQSGGVQTTKSNGNCPTCGSGYVAVNQRTSVARAWLQDVRFKQVTRVLNGILKSNSRGGT